MAAEKGANGAQSESKKPALLSNIRTMNRNVLLNLVLSFCQGLADNIWVGTILVTYLYDATGQFECRDSCDGPLPGNSTLPMSCTGSMQGTLCSNGQTCSECGGSNTKVGLVTALQGASQLLTALPAGWAADVYSLASAVLALCG